MQNISDEIIKQLNFRKWEVYTGKEGLEISPLNIAKQAIIRIDDEIDTGSYFNKDLYAQDINKDLETEYNYTISVSDEDSANYDQSMCMLYVSGNEISNNQREILLNENYPQKIIFDGFKKIRYLYLLTNDTRETGFYLNNHNFANYSVKIIYDSKESETKKISMKEYFFLKKEMVVKNCQSSLCKIIIDRASSGVLR